MLAALRGAVSQSTDQRWSDLFTGKRIHLIGIGGAGMQALAGVLLRCGAVVSGSDRQASAATEQLGAAGAQIRIGQNEQNVPERADLVVFSAAIPDSNPELQAAQKRQIPCIRYAEMLGLLMRQRHGIAIAGTHGKSTTTALVAFVLKSAGLDPTFVVGADVQQLGGPSGVGDGPHFVAEACEFDRSFLHLYPATAAILNIEEDHLDCYGNLEAIEEAFGRFASLLPARDGLLIANADAPATIKAGRATAARIETFGLDEPADWRAGNLERKAGTFAFDLIRRDQCLGRVELALLGRHNVSNALAAAAIAVHCGIEPEQVCTHLSRFRGADRRMTFRGRFNGVAVVDDYAHHPTEVRVTLQAAREHYQPAKLWVVFQPHQHSRTRFLLEQFAESLTYADAIILPDIYFVRDSQQERQYVSSRDLVDRLRRRGKQADYVPQFSDIVEILGRRCRPGDLVLTMGAGNIWKVADALVQRP